MLAVATLVFLWIALKISKFVMKAALLALLLGLAGLVIWYLFLR
jgi:hypothetical protein